MKHIFVAALCGFCLLSCSQRTCFNENPIFDKFAPQSEKYKDELAKELSKSPEVSFSIAAYKDGESVDTLYVKVKGDDVCAMGLFQVDKKSEVLAGVRKNMAAGYVGAGLMGPQFKIVGNELVLEDVEWIVD